MERKRKLAQDLTGMVFGQLTVIEYAGNEKGGPKHWLCKCSCGTVFTTRAWNLTSGRSKTCGCSRTKAGLPSKIRKGTDENAKIFHPLYTIWNGIKQRCNCPSYKRYSDYGGRGIQLCERWLTFENFVEDMGERPSNKHSVDRIDNNGNYEPGNCRWATVAEQAKNKRTNVYVDYKGEKMILADAARLAGLEPTFASRRNRQGIPLDKPVRSRKR